MAVWFKVNRYVSSPTIINHVILRELEITHFSPAGDPNVFGLPTVLPCKVSPHWMVRADEDAVGEGVREGDKDKSVHDTTTT